MVKPHHSDPLLDSLERKYDHKKGLLVDIGCGIGKKPEFVGIDKRDLPTVDIVHDVEEFPWPLPAESCWTLLARHLIEHIKPWLMMDFMNEAWRVLKVDGQFALSMPYGLSFGYIQDPTHCNPCNQATWQYFDPDYPLYKIYEPKPWHIETNVYQLTGNLEVVLKKRDIYHKYNPLKLIEKDGKVVLAKKLESPGEVDK